jgi:hypothetical protein
MVECKLCETEFKSLNALHKHLTISHKLQQKDYYNFNYPKIDLGDGSFIVYKNYEQYFSTEFNSRRTFSVWAQEKENFKEVQEYILRELTRRKNLGKISFYPSQVELKNLILPSMNWIKRIYSGFDSYFSQTKHLDLGQKFNYNIESVELRSGDLNLIIDSREQRPLYSKTEFTCHKLPVGDYACGGDMNCGVYIERKSLADLAGTLTNGFDRFTREIEKAKNLGLYLVVLCDESYVSCLEYSPSNSFARKVNGHFILHQIREIMQKHDNIQFVFCSDRGRSREVLEKIFRMGALAKTVDIEYLKDGGLI